MARQKAQSTHSNNLMSALKFVGISGADFCSISQNIVTAFTEHVCIGHPIEEDLNAQAHIKKLYQSLLKSGEKTTITQLELSKLHVNSGVLQVYIACSEKINQILPDAPFIEIDRRFTDSIETLLPLVSVYGDTISTKTILCNDKSMFATNRYILTEYWHGIYLPFLNMSKKFCDIVLKSKKEVNHLGYSENSITVYFKDKSWIMGRVSKDNWINPYAILDKRRCSYEPISDDFKMALKAVPGFSDSGLAYCASGCLQSHPSAKDGASYPVPGLPEGGVFGVKELNYLNKNADMLDMSDKEFIMFTGKNIRGAIVSRKV
jgi:hypothetical protein